MQTKISYLLLLFILLIPKKSLSQINSDKKIYQIAIVPQYIAQHGIRIDFETQVKASKHSIMLSPQFYYNENQIHYDNDPSNYNYEEQDYEKFIGYGIGLHHKIYTNNTEDTKWNFYITYGAEYANFTMDYKSWQWVEYVEDGLSYLNYQLLDVEQSTNRIRADINIGIQFNYVDNLFLDFYLGTGGVYSINNMQPETIKPIKTTGIYNYAYTGIYMPMGFKFGFRF